MPRIPRCLFLLILSGFLPALAASDSAAEKKAELAALRERIQTVQSEQREAVGERDRLTRELADVERRLAELNRELARLEDDIRQHDRQLAGLETEQHAAHRELDGQKQALAEQIRAAYAAGRQEKLKLLLNQEDPAQLGRMLVYYEYLNQARAEQIGKVRAALERLAQVGARIRAKREALAQLQAERQKVRDRLLAARSERRQVLAGLAEDIRDRDARLARLRRDEQTLQNLVRRLESVFADIPEGLGSDAAFDARRGRLDWPIRGTVARRFGEMQDGGLRSEGVLIRGESGSEVRAVARGRVAYADWLPHYGMLVILEHGNGYMSLYGHNQALYVEPGAWVGEDEVIAAVGDTGGQQTAGLYFEIRHDGQPVDPARWLQNR